MQLLTRTYRHFRQLLGQNAWFTGAIVAGLIGLEIAGRQGTSDWHDAIHLLLLLFLSVLILIRHRQRPLADAMRPRPAPVSFEPRKRNATAAHADWVEQGPLDRLLIGHVGDARDHFAR